MSTLRKTLLIGAIASAQALAQGGPGGGGPGGGGPGGGPPPVPPVPVPAENPITEAKRVLGKMLFWDEQLSSDNTIACGTCHITEFGGTDPRPANHPGPDSIFGTADDIHGTRGVIGADTNNDYEPNANFGLDVQVTDRASQNFFGALWSPRQFWDGRAQGPFLNPETGAVSIATGGSLEEQVSGPPVSDVEMAHANRDWSEITAKLTTVTPLRLATNLPTDVANALAGGADYPQLFQNAFGSAAITAERISFAIATYERTLVADQTPWDAFRAGNANALTQAQRRGLNFFAGSVCSQCHRAPLFTDNNFHNIGLRPWQEDDGRRGVTGNFNDRGEFKTPSLRNVGLRARLMHNGRITDVRDSLDFYRSGTTPGTGHTQFTDGQDPRVRNINIPPNVLNDLTDFLENGLTDPRVANGTFPFDRPTLLSERPNDRAQVFGPATPGSGAIPPRMIARTPLTTDNPDFKCGIENGLGGATAFLVLSSDQAIPGTSFGDISIHIDLSQTLLSIPVLLQGSSAGEGYATWKLAVRDDPAVVGLSLVGQWFVADTGAMTGLSATEGARWTIF